MTWQLDERLRQHDQPYECPDPCILCERERSLARILFAILCTAISLAIVVVSA